MNHRHLLEDPPEGAAWEFPAAEYRRRLDGGRRCMAELEITCLLLTSENAIRYFTGFHSQTWVSPTRPRYVLLPGDGEPVAIIPTGNVLGFKTTSWIADIRSWPAPRPDDDGITLLLDALRGLTNAGDRIGVEIGPEMRLGMPVRDFLRVRDALEGRQFVDGGPVIHSLWAVKSPEEIVRIRRAAQIACDAFDELPGMLHAGQTEREVYSRFFGLLVARGAEKVPYLVPVSGPGGYAEINMGPSDRRLASGDVLFIDVGATWRGYFCDFDRNFSIGPPSVEVRSAYDRLYEATEAGLAAIRPGRATADVWRAMATVLDPGGRAETPVGRMGHGLGMSLTEPPSIALGDSTVLQEGMVITLEPSLMLPPIAWSVPRLMVHEENVLVTRGGYELLTRRAPSSLTFVDA